MHDLETLRSSVGLPVSLAYYFVNESVNKHATVSACMAAVVEKVIIIPFYLLNVDLRNFFSLILF